ncbi:hypothetical protein OG884_15415 [Streptosporangium sp. NBC_01755]|uniref:hypothetical protein n=1 Tax=Streptosporangium sp. NBC_01755 TaxID=2975949 RepID=UPI002DDA8DA4|nr:hypothetical protein [Streptosporangium sp. NBC_01755]WSD03222.1 hypothetical protein OG884_15415 [Streptosporangium sp. NBC_01755]
MGWTSPRKDGDHAKKVGERMAGAYEEELGRTLTADELRQVHAEAEKTVRSWGETGRKS